MPDYKNDYHITQEILRQLFSYDAETGVAVWKERGLEFFAHTKRPESNMKIWNSGNAGSVIGTTIDGYTCCKLFGKLYRLHRLIWVWYYGNWPEGQIDHKNGVRNDNKIENLRVVTPLENMRNMGKSKANKSGHVGVSWKPSANFWQARIKVNNKNIHLGYYKTIEPAIEARKQAEDEFGFTGRHKN